MSRFLLFCFILSNAFLVPIMAEKGPVHADPPATSAPAPPPTAARKLGKHHHHHHKTLNSVSGAPGLSPSEPPKPEENKKINPTEVSSSSEESGTTQVAEIKISHHHGHHIDKSIAGGGVILGGLATAFLVAVFCYIRATGRKNAEPGSPVN